MTGIHRQITNKSGKLLYGDLTDKIISLSYQIHYQYGSGHKESVYQNIFAEKLELRRLKFEKEFQVSICSEDTGRVVGYHRLDFIVDNKVVVEIKAIKFTPQKMEQQLYSYLKNSNFQVGLMINFGSSKLYIRRIILT